VLYILNLLLAKVSQQLLNRILSLRK
jgi:hypothetical protein